MSLVMYHVRVTCIERERERDRERVAVCQFEIVRQYQHLSLELYVSIIHTLLGIMLVSRISACLVGLL